jgi:putative membrane protein
MQIVRTVLWVLLLVALAIFTYANWNPVTVRIWDNLLVDTMLPAIVVVSFLIGFVPLWLYHRAAKWQFNRRIAALELAARTAATPAPAPTAPESAPENSAALQI